MVSQSKFDTLSKFFKLKHLKIYIVFPFALSFHTILGQFSSCYLQNNISRISEVHSKIVKSFSLSVSSVSASFLATSLQIICGGSFPMKTGALFLPVLSDQKMPCTSHPEITSQLFPVISLSNLAFQYYAYYVKVDSFSQESPPLFLVAQSFSFRSMQESSCKRHHSFHHFLRASWYLTSQDTSQSTTF